MGNQLVLNIGRMLVEKICLGDQSKKIGIVNHPMFVHGLLHQRKSAQNHSDEYFGLC